MLRKRRDADAVEADRQVEIARIMAGYSLAGEVDAEAERAALADMRPDELRVWCGQRVALPAVGSCARIALDHLDLAEEAAA